MKDIAIYGAGGLGREVKILIDQINFCSPQWNFIGFFDDGGEENFKADYYGKLVGGINRLNNWEYPLCVILAFGNPRSIAKIRNKINNPNITFPNIVSPDVFIPDQNTFEIGEGNLISRQCNFSIDTKIGSFNIFNGFIGIGHDVTIGNYNVFMPGAKISGEVTIGNENMIGAGAFVVQQNKIGDRIVLSPYSVLLVKPRDGKTYIGNPAKIFRF